ncbi:adhesion G-protein coupled receptor G7-like [Lytechinus pictus]|uniref:adhesion G-protein coupled receptor G7-like n=1 Tax=Lytechinus pictus TaxID=7653 RepID=UPI0030B9B2A3
MYVNKAVLRFRLSSKMNGPVLLISIFLFRNVFALTDIPNAVLVDSVTAYSVSVSWTPFPGSVSYQVVYTGPDQTEGQVFSTSPYTILTGLTPVSRYDITVRSLLITQKEIDVGNVTAITGPDRCGQNPCLYGTCLGEFFLCICEIGFTGPYCETDINECISPPCQNGASCINTIGGYQCQCIPGFTGVDCDTNIDECLGLPCLNSGSCLDAQIGYYCVCPVFYTGQNCEIGAFCNMTSQDTVYGEATLDRSIVGSVMNSSTACPFNTTQAGAPILTGYCTEEVFGYSWTIEVNCRGFRGALELLEEILEEGITEDNLEESAYRVAIITMHSEDFTALEANLVADIMESIAWWNSSNYNVTTSSVLVVNNVMNIDEEELFTAQEQNESPSRLVQGLERQVGNIELNSTTAFDERFANIAAKVQTISSSDASNGVVIRMSGLDITDFSETNTSITAIDSSSNRPTTATLVQTVVPAEALRLPLEDDIASLIQSPRIIYMVYTSDVLYPSKYIQRLNENNGIFIRTVNTPVVAVIVGGQKVEGLSQSVNFTFSNIMSENYDPVCTFWDTGTGNWSTRGCTLVSVGPDTSFTQVTVPENVDVIDTNSVTCACDHLTSFAVIVDLYPDGRPNKVFRWLSIIGCGISIISLIITVVTYLSLLKKLRSSRVDNVQLYILLCFCVTLLGLYVAFLVIIGFDRESRVAELGIIPCSVVAGLAHFFALSSMTWMGIEGFHIYMTTVRIINTYIPKFMIKAILVGWGIPAAIVGTTGGLLRGDYAARDFCYVQQWALIGGFLVPMGVILLTNTIIFLLAICRLCQSARLPGRVWKDREAERRASIERTQTGVSFLVLMGLTWSTGYLVLLQDDTSEVLFIIFNSLQGFFIFVLACLRKRVVRQRWKELCCTGCSEPEKNGSRSSRDLNKPSHGSHSSSTPLELSGLH